MTKRPPSDTPMKPSGPAAPSGDREARLGAALKANLARRKAQARARAGGRGPANADKTKTKSED
ncbi:MAG: hypothetical protein KDK02_00360 [Rhodobacteraceae bacterium]|nr:hypothetical protein [Paracoccaceae bacterium]